MTTAVYAYMVIYALFCASVVADDVKDGEPLWETLGDFVLFSLGFVGMLLYQGGVTGEGVRTLWKVVSVSLVAGQILVNFYSRREVLKGGANREDGEITQGSVLFADLFVIALLLPCLAINLIFAYGPFS